MLTLALILESISLRVCRLIMMDCSYLTFDPFAPLGLQIAGYNGPLTIGESATVTCSFDLDFITIEWFYNGQMIASSSVSETELVFNPVNDSIHNRQYTCRVTTMFGTQEDSITITVQGNVC